MAASFSDAKIITDTIGDLYALPRRDSLVWIFEYRCKTAAVNGKTVIIVWRQSSHATQRACTLKFIRHKPPRRCGEPRQGGASGSDGKTSCPTMKILLGNRPSGLSCPRENYRDLQTTYDIFYMRILSRELCNPAKFINRTTVIGSNSHDYIIIFRLDCL